ncbi:Phosphate transporter family [Proteiniphilum saccharofermentans]|uniref:Phosphate transporter n=1 Tax=Proteiniphilum saccharofermentans TaxID=1642647 RepID=A0A1R3TDI7_9BACT|nr:inorganic phosphate transporter [Proteiniphilum saccharofermentans]SCD22065.1 Phosphate transporter family [Proteiniphilum saccharofermentans]
MFIYLFLVSGLFLGWSLGANDASNIFGTAVGTRMVKFRTAAIIGSIFVILGAVIQGAGTTKTLSELGSVNMIGGAFTVALCAAIIVTIMTKYRLPISTGQAIVGAIIGWCYYTSNPVEYGILVKIVGSWVFGPILGAVFSFVLYLLVRKFIHSSRMHMLKMESIIRTSLIIVGAFAAYSLGANNIANVMGVFVNSFSVSLSIGSLYISSTQLLFFIGSLAIALGIFTYSKKVMYTIGNGVLSMTPEMAIVAVLAQALVLFIFSSTSLSNALISTGLPPIPLVPVSSTQVLVGALIGVGLVKGVQELKMKMLGNIMLSWITTPILSAAFTFVSLFFVDRVFGIPVSDNEIIPDPVVHAEQAAAVTYYIPVNATNKFFLMALILLVIAFIIYTVVLNKRNYAKARAEGYRQAEQNQFSDYQKALNEIEVSTVQLENVSLATRLEEKKNQLITYSLNIGEQRRYLELISDSIEQAIRASTAEEKNKLLRNQLIEIKQRMSFSGEVDEIYRQAEQVHMEFIEKLNESYPNLTNKEKKILVLLRIGLSSKEMAPLLNISTKSVEISRYRLRTKMGLNRNDSLTQFIQSL